MKKHHEINVNGVSVRVVPMTAPVLSIVVPCYNEAQVLPITIPRIMAKIDELIGLQLISENSFSLFVDDGSKDDTWNVVCEQKKQFAKVRAIRLSRNRGHQNALLAGLMEVRESADCVVSIDCDGQDDMNAINQMIVEYNNGSEIVYGCRDDRTNDSWFKRYTAEFFYRLLRWLGAEVVFNHADFRLASARVLKELSQFGEVNLFLRGLFPLIGFRTAKVYYKRTVREAGESHYPLFKMIGLAVDGITSLSVKPIRLIAFSGFVVSSIAFIMIVWSFVSYLRGAVVPGWTSNVLCVSLFGGIQLLSIGVIGEYVGKIYLEVKHRPRYIVSERI